MRQVGRESYGSRKRTFTRGFATDRHQLRRRGHRSRDRHAGVKVVEVVAALATVYRGADYCGGGSVAALAMAYCVVRESVSVTGEECCGD